LTAKTAVVISTGPVASATAGATGADFNRTLRDCAQYLSERIRFAIVL